MGLSQYSVRGFWGMGLPAVPHLSRHVPTKTNGDANERRAASTTRIDFICLNVLLKKWYTPGKDYGGGGEWVDGRERAVLLRNIIYELDDALSVSSVHQ